MTRIKMHDRYLYVLLNIGTISIPLLASFYPKASFSKTWKAFFPAMLITGAFFIVWDIWFTHLGVWGFNSQYITGVYVLGLPIEEWLFFFTIPYACTFTYFSLRYLLKNNPLRDYHRYLSLLLIVGLSIIGLYNYDKYYTASALLLTSIVLTIVMLSDKNNMMGHFYLMYFITLIPFFIVNGMLTGTGIEDQVVWYNNFENLALRIGTIPVEDMIYGMLLLLMNVTLYERLLSKNN